MSPATCNGKDFSPAPYVCHAEHISINMYKGWKSSGAVHPRPQLSMASWVPLVSIDSSEQDLTQHASFHSVNSYFNANEEGDNDEFLLVLPQEASRHLNSSRTMEFA